ncbi:MAG: SNF2-related protein [Bacillota bacterium]
MKVNDILEKNDVNINNKSIKVKNITKLNNIYYFSVLENNNIYTVQINIKDKNSIKRISCTCKDKKENEYCIHTLKALFTYKNKYLKKDKFVKRFSPDLISKNIKPSNESIENYIKKVSNYNKNQENKDNKILNYYFEFKDKIYIKCFIENSLIDLIEFINFLSSDENKFIINDKIIYDKKSDSLKINDQRIFDILAELNKKFFLKSKIRLSYDKFYSILKFINNSIFIKYKNKKYKDIKVTLENDIFLSIEKKEDNLLFKSKKLKKSTKFVFGKLEIYLNKKNLVVLRSDNKKRLLKIFDKKFEKIIDKKHIKKFIDLAYNKDFTENFKIKNSLEKEIQKPNYISELFLLTKGKKIVAKFKFKKEEVEGKYIVDDKEKLIEAKDYIQILLKSFGFNKVKNKYILKNSEKIYNFYKEELKKLEKDKNISVFYTQKFKNYFKKIKNIDLDIKKGNNDLLSLEFQIDQFNKDELINIFNSIKKKEKFIELNEKTMIDLDTEEFKNLKSLFDNVKLDNEKEEISLNKYKAAYALSNIDSKNIKINDKHEYSKILEKIKNFHKEDIYVNKLEDRLRNYQIEGVKWLKLLKTCKLGGILADEMGLGKTVQVISLLKDINEKNLIVVPSSLIYNWESEFRKFGYDKKILLVHGKKDERRKKIEKINDYDLIITTYPLIRRDIDYYKDYKFEYFIIDEAQYIKNYQTKTSKSVKEIKANYRLALTGTPIENDLVELWSIFEFIMPGYLIDKKQFIDKYVDNNNYDLLLKKVSPFILRRSKKEVLDELPDKIETILYSEMKEKQNKIYNSYLLQMKKKLDEMDNKETSQIQILSFLTRLRQICCDPGLFVENYNEKSGKIILLEELIEELIDGNHKILIFSQFTSMLKIVKKLLKKKNIKFSYLDGQTKVSKRKEVIDNFKKKSIDIFLISLKTGGTGLNLTKADTVIHLDPWWNPAVEDQATDRAHRIGQKDTVNVYKILMKDSIEENIYKIQLRKRKIINNIMKSDKVNLSFNKKDILEVINDL